MCCPSRRHWLWFLHPRWRSKGTGHRGVPTKVMCAEDFLNNAEGFSCPFPAGMNGGGAVNAHCWKSQPREVKHYFQKRCTHPLLNVWSCKGESVLCISQSLPTGMLGTVQDQDSEKVQSSSVSEPSGKEMTLFLAVNMLLIWALALHCQAQHRNICRFAKMGFSEYINFFKVSASRGQWWRLWFPLTDSN